MTKNKSFMVLCALLCLTCSCEKANNSENLNSDGTSIFDEEMFYQDEVKDDNYYFKDSKDYSTNQDAMNSVYNQKWDDPSNQIKQEEFTYADIYVNGKQQKDLTDGVSGNAQLNALFYSSNYARVVSRVDGYALTLPTTQIIKPDLSISKYRTQYEHEDYILTVSKESGNPYNNWTTYHDDWLVKYLVATGDSKNTQYLKTFFNLNGLEYSIDPYISQSMVNNREVEMISIQILEHENISMPYYNIAIIKGLNDHKNFTLFVMKSKEESSSLFEQIVRSYTPLTSYGNYAAIEPYELKVPTYLNLETQKYYKKLMEQEYTSWGMFIHSIGTNNGNVNLIDSKTKAFESKEQMDYEFDIMPTYTGTGKYTNPAHFPAKEALQLAGGNGFNGKKVLQFTLQYTSTNNSSLYSYTPMYDILRGKYDDYFKRLAGELKEYGKPILFRVNNEMNSDWTSYCGMVTLLDPDIFQMTWERMAKIFEEEGVDNILYIFNPTAKSYPYCSWGEDLCYLPSLKYVQILGLTYYEYNNYSNGEEPMSFLQMYQWLYNKNFPQWSNFPAVISEFGCGSGGNYPASKGALYRNVISQTIWVEDMFLHLNCSREDYPSIAQIKAAIWFDANDTNGSDSMVINQLVLDNVHTKSTIIAFKEGLAETKKLKDKYK